MRKKILQILFLLCILLLVNNIKAATWNSYSAGSGSSLSISSGEWSSSAVAVKVSIVDNNGVHKETKFLFNNNGYKIKYGYDLELFNELKPKYLYGNNIQSITINKNYINNPNNKNFYFSSVLPSDWENGSSKINLHSFLVNNKYENLMKLLELDKNYRSSLFTTLDPNNEYYIIIEPMIQIANFYGTAYDYILLYGNKMTAPKTCTSSTTGEAFCRYYTASLFGGGPVSRGTLDGGLFYKTMYISSNQSLGTGSVVLTACDKKRNSMTQVGSNYYSTYASIIGERNTCFGKNQGRGIGVYKYRDFVPPPTPTPKTTITLKKVNTSGTIIATSPTEFQLYKGSGCSVKAESIILPKGETSLSLENGNYSIKETKAPDGYKETNECFNFNVDGAAKTIEIENEPKPEPSCPTDLDIALSDRYYSATEAFELFNKYPENNQLLNIESPTCSDQEQTRETDISCLEFWSYSPGFSETNLSNYEYFIKNATDEYIGFCASSFDYLKNNNVISNNLTNLNNLAAGKELLSSNLVIGFFDMNIECYSIEKLAENDIPRLKTAQIYFGDNDSNNKADLLDNYYTEGETVSVPRRKMADSELYNSYRSIYKYAYFNKIYIKPIEGKVSFTKQNNYIEFQGILSPVKEANRDEITDGVIPFEVKYGGDIYTSNECVYSTKPELITKKLELEFRIIDTNTPFTGKTGSNRETNTNWCGEDNLGNKSCASDNSTVINNIINANNSYNKEGQAALYRIELNASDIKLIREYNKTHPYDNYETTNIGMGANTQVVNTFLNNLSNGNLNGSISKLEKNVLYEQVESDGSILAPQYGQVQFNLVEEDSDQSLTGRGKLAIYKGNDCIDQLQNITLNNGSAIISLPQGNYSVKQTQPPDRYLLNGACYNFSVNETTTTLNIVNRFNVTEGIIQFYLVDSSNNEVSATGGKISIYEGTNCQNSLEDVTPSKGSVNLILPVGQYSAKQTQAAEGYSQDNSCYNIYIDELVEFVNIKNNPISYQMQFRLFDENNSLISSSGGKFTIYNDFECKTSLKDITISNGVAEETLPYGWYSVKQTHEADGYSKDESCHLFKAYEAQNTVDIINKQKPIQIKFRLVDENDNIISSNQGKFTIYNGYNCKTSFKNVTTSKGIAEEALTYGQYSIKQTETEAGFVLNTSCQNFDVNASTKNVNIINEAKASIASAGDYDLNISAGSLVLKSDQKISSCNIGSIRGTVDNSTTIFQHKNKCELNLESLVPTPKYADGGIYRYYYIYDAKFQSGQTYSSCLRVIVYRQLSGVGAPKREYEFKDMRCCANQASCG